MAVSSIKEKVKNQTTVEMTVIQRISVEALIVQRPRRPFEQQLLSYEILNKFKLGEKERASYMHKVGDRLFPNQVAIDTAPPTRIELTDVQADELYSILTTSDVGVADIEWILPLKAQLR